MTPNFRVHFVFKVGRMDPNVRIEFSEEGGFWQLPAAPDDILDIEAIAGAPGILGILGNHS